MSEFKSISDRIDAYHKKIQAETTLTDFNTLEVQQKLPSIKHYYAAQLIYHKIDLQKLQDEKEQLVNSLADAYISKQPIAIPKSKAIRTVSETSKVKEYTKQIKDQALMVEYLTLVDRNLNQMSFDIKNLVELIKIENT